MKPMSEMMKDVHNKAAEGPVGQAIKFLDDCVKAAVAKGLYKTVPLWKCCAIVVDHVRVQREALLVAAQVVELFEKGDVKQAAGMIAEFKKYAVRARLHQFVEPTKYPSLEEQLRSPGEPPLKQ